jgi:hypothetical protein
MLAGKRPATVECKSRLCKNTESLSQSSARRMLLNSGVTDVKMTFDELRYVAAIKVWNKAQKDSFEKMKESPLYKMMQVTHHEVVDNPEKICSSFDWFVALIERETGVTCDKESIDIAERLAKVQYGLRKRDQG